MSGKYYFVIVGHYDNPVFEMEFSPPSRSEGKVTFWSAGDVNIDAQPSILRMRFLMLHDTKNEDGIKNFFIEIYELYIKHAMNPFYEHNSPIKSAVFEKKTQFFGRKYLTG
ncbi:trafficking protein particle complex subunit 2-like [Centruroides sculpturatus]|uniref:trafficking protein particle complex subunit 2-like n=1 Tax=Centruroides sculpturatus TaxID=218467 RepID=UPI000C6DDD33|nr:trafficking protein particle complex subunit 2-like [Centruroides sculpturatus]